MTDLDNFKTMLTTAKVEFDILHRGKRRRWKDVDGKPRYVPTDWVTREMDIILELWPLLSFPIHAGFDVNGAIISIEKPADPD